MKKLSKKELELLVWMLSAVKMCGSQTPDFRSYCLGYYSGMLFVMKLFNFDEEPPEKLPEIEELTAMLAFVVEDFKKIQKKEAKILKKAEGIGEKMIETAFELYEKGVM